MNFSNNPFRILAVESNSGAKKIQKNLSKLKAYSKIGKSVAFDYDLSFLNLAPVDRSLEIISKVESRILLDENKIKYSLFWFQDTTPFDSIALANLFKENTDKSLDIWSKSMKSNEVKANNFSAFNNYSSLLLLLQLKKSKTDCLKTDTESITNIQIAIGHKIKLINSDYFVDYCLSIGVKSDIDAIKIQTYFLETMLEVLNQNFSSNDLKKLLKGMDPAFSDLINGNLVKGPISNIKEQISAASVDLKNDVTQGIFIGKALIKNTISDLKYLKDTLGGDHYQYESLSDKLSNQILQCGINYFNETSDDQAYLSSYKYALSIASGEKTKTRAKETINHCEEEKQANICSCCSTSKIDRNSPYVLAIYKETKRTSFPRRVEYSQGSLNLFFCKSCLTKATEKDSTAQIITWIFAIVGGIFAGISTEHFVGLLVGGFFGLGIGNFIGGLFSADNSSIIKNHPTTRKYIKQGYQLSQPTA